MKHLIEIYPVTFPNGEPKLEDLNSVRVLPTGQCFVDRRFNIDQKTLQISDSKTWRQIDSSMASRKAMRRYTQCYEIQEDAPWTLSHRSDF